MAKIYRTTDKIPVNIGGLVFKISPLSRLHKSEIQADLIDGNVSDAAYKAVKYAVKDVSGLQDDNGDYELQFDDAGALSEDCLDDLTNLAQSSSIQLVCLAIVNGIPESFTDPETGKKIKGVDYAESGETKGKKSKKTG